MQFHRGQGQYPLPQEMTKTDIMAAVAGFVQAAGFDGVEITGDNRYLLDQFLTEGINTDARHRCRARQVQRD